MLLALLALVGMGVLVAGLYLPNTGRDVIADRLAAFNQRPKNLRELELQQPFSERVLRPIIRQLAEALNRLQQERSKTPRDNVLKGMKAIQLKLALAGTPYRWTAADYLGVKAFAALVLWAVLLEARRPRRGAPVLARTLDLMGMDAPAVM